MNDRLTQLENEVRDLKQYIDSLKQSSSIPIEIDKSFRERFNEVKLQITDFTGAVPKASTYKDQAVNEGGVATYNVLKSPTLFLVVTIGSTNYYLPAYT